MVRPLILGAPPPVLQETQLRARGKFTFQGRSVSRADFLATVGEKIPALQPRLRDTTGRWQVIIHTRRMYEIDPSDYDEEDVIRTLKTSQVRGATRAFPPSDTL